MIRVFFIRMILSFLLVIVIYFYCYVIDWFQDQHSKVTLKAQQHNEGRCDDILQFLYVIQYKMRKREIKKTVISYEQDQGKKEDKEKEKERERERERSREKKERERVQVVDVSSRRARLQMMKKRRDEEQMMSVNQEMDAEPVISINSNLQRVQTVNPQPTASNVKVKLQNQNKPIQKPSQNNQQQIQSQNQSQSSGQQRILLKPVYICKQNRQQDHASTKQRQEQRKKKAIRYTTKLLLLENAKDNKEESDEEIVHSSDQEKEKEGTMPDDDDTKGEEFQYELWKVRELKRIRRDREERRKIEMEKAQIQRRRKMNNQQILLQNKVMGSDATDNPTQTKYVYLQKYYHKGAFYQDSQDPIFKRDYNLPTPLEMQDKSMLPQILQRRQGNFGKKGQSKYKHLTAEDTTNFDPQFRPDQSIMASWKKKMAGYKGAGGSNI